MMVEGLPVGADPPGHPPQQMTGQVGHLHPGQDQIAGIVSNQVQVVAVGLLGGAHELVAQIKLPGGRTPGRQATGRLPPRPDT